LDDLVKLGKIRYFGCSNFNAWQVCESIWTSSSLGINSFVSVQPHYSMLERVVEKELIPFCDKYNLGILPYFPLANGFLTGKYKRDQAIPKGTRLEASDRFDIMSDENFNILDELTTFCKTKDKSILDLAFAWLLWNKNISSVIAGATKPEQVIANALACEWELSDEEYHQVTEILN
jgi:aryl-alcohol dehydrogenase-like predicted oxidoreductase